MMRWQFRYGISLGIALFLILVSGPGIEGVEAAVRSGRIPDDLDPARESIRLDGDWEFYWGQLLEPGSVGVTPDRISVPGAWNGHAIDGYSLPGVGYATYRLVFEASQPARLAFKLPRIFTAHELWVNGDMIASAGVIGRTPESAEPQYLPEVAVFTARRGENEILVRVANQHHRSGGILESLWIGPEDAMWAMRHAAMAREFFLFGALLVLGAYHLVIYFFRKEERSVLYFGLFSLLVAVRTLLVGERYLAAGAVGFSWEMAHNVQTLSFYLGVPLAFAFFGALFPNLMCRRVLFTIQGIAIAFAAVVVLSPARVFTRINPGFQAFTVLAILYLLYLLGRAVRRPKPGTGFVVAGALVLVLTTIHDIVFLSVWMNDSNPGILRSFLLGGNLSSVGQLFFVFTHALLLASRFSGALRGREQLSEELRRINANLDSMVRRRTADLEDARSKVERQRRELQRSNRILRRISLHDALTGLWNRRKFDEALNEQWRRCRREGSPLSLLIIDIDCFKEFNDHYGHKAGDDCLVAVADALAGRFRRSTDLVARYGGEEFVVLMSGWMEGNAPEMAERAREAVESLGIAHPASPLGEYLTVSVGLATVIPDASLSPGDLFAAADEALYRAKKVDGKNAIIQGAVEDVEVI